MPLTLALGSPGLLAKTCCEGEAEPTFVEEAAAVVGGLPRSPLPLSVLSVRILRSLVLLVRLPCVVRKAASVAMADEATGLDAYGAVAVLLSEVMAVLGLEL